MKGLSCNSGLLSQFAIERAIDILADQDYQGIDISLEKAPPFLPPPLPHMSPQAGAKARSRVRKHAEQAGVVIVALNAHTNLIHAVPEARQANLEFVKKALELAMDLGARYVVVGGGRKEFYGRESQYWEKLVTALRHLTVNATRLGVNLAVEAGSFPGSLLHNLSRMQYLLSHDGLETLGVLFDSGHYQVRGDSVVEAYRALSQRVVHVHAKDAKGNLEDFEFPPLGQGDVDFDGLLGTMVAAGYDGYISIEYEAFAWGYESDPRKVLSESKGFLDRILALKP
jgi:inosose dehydratase